MPSNAPSAVLPNPTSLSWLKPNSLKTILGVGSSNVTVAPNVALSSPLTWQSSGTAFPRKRPWRNGGNTSAPPPQKTSQIEASNKALLIIYMTDKFVDHCVLLLGCIGWGYLFRPYRAERNMIFAL